MAIVVSDIDSYVPCKIPGCPHHEKTPTSSSTKLTQTTPESNNQLNNPGKRKDNSSFEYAPLRKTVRKIVLDFPANEEINLSPNKYALPQKVNLNNLESPGSTAIEKNPSPPRIETRNTESNNSTNQSTAQNPLPPPVMLFIEENYKTQMAAITKIIPKNPIPTNG
ncbi:hypothetical protein TNCV_3331041 [Trichonephila clavipes]|nr:hypothetical protein TNCV_3331041 [Trichonephila clavipes]